MGSLGIEVSRVGRLVDLRFAGQRRLVDLQRDGLRQPSVGGHFSPLCRDHRVADYDVALGHLGHVATSRTTLTGVSSLVLFSTSKIFIASYSNQKATPVAEEDCAEDTDRLGELVVDESYAERKQGGDQQDADHRIVELLEKEPHSDLRLGGVNTLAPYRCRLCSTSAPVSPFGWFDMTVFTFK